MIIDSEKKPPPSSHSFPQRDGRQTITNKTESVLGDKYKFPEQCTDD
jgi:hypothetical protein